MIFSITYKNDLYFMKTFDNKNYENKETLTQSKGQIKII